MDLASNDCVSLDHFIPVAEAERARWEPSGLRLVFVLDCLGTESASSAVAEETARELFLSRNAPNPIWIVRDPVKDYAAEIGYRNRQPSSESAQDFANRCLRLLKNARPERIIRLEETRSGIAHALCALAASLDLPLGPYFGSLSEHLANGESLESEGATLEDGAAMEVDTALHETAALSLAMAELKKHLGYAIEKAPDVKDLAPYDELRLKTDSRTDERYAATIPADLHQILGVLRESISAIRTDLSGMTKHLDWVVKSEAQNVSRQVEAFLSLGHALRGEASLPVMHGWPISPDFALLLVSMIRRSEYQAVIEFGSGTSTVVVARALSQRRISQPTSLRPVQMAFEHLEEFSNLTVRGLRECDMDNAVSIHVAPLIPCASHNGQSYLFYDCHDAIGSLNPSSSPADPRVLVIVDGPPGVTGPHARLPALEVVMRALPRWRIDLLLDDYGRQEEKEIGAKWKAHLESVGASFTAEEFDLEKGALLLTIEPMSRDLE